MLVRNRLKPVALCADIKQTFLQVRIREADRDALRFHWIRDSSQVETLRSTRARFIQNSKKGKKHRLSGTLTTCETDRQASEILGRKSSNSRLNTDKFHEDQLKLNLHEFAEK